MIYGGGHQNGLRSGTLNVPGIVGLGEACALRQQDMPSDETKIAELRLQLQNTLQQVLPDLYLTGDLEQRLAGNLHVCIPHVPNDVIIAKTRDKLSLSRGAACSSGVEAPSHVLQALELPRHLMDGALRLSLGKDTSSVDIEQASKIMIQAVKEYQRKV